MARKVVVTGASGTVGREVVSALQAMGRPVRVLTRNADVSNFPKGVEVFEGDLSQPDTLSGLFAGAVSAHLIAFSGPNYEPLETGAELVDLLTSANVRRLTVLWNGEGKAGTLEKAVKASKMEWTVLEPQEYMANALGWADAIREGRLVEEPCIHRPTAAIHEKDLGAAIARILVSGGHANKTYTLTGPEVLSPKIQVAAIARAIGKSVAIRELSEVEARKRWEGWGIPEHIQNYLYEWYSLTPPVGYTVTDHVESITGRPASTFEAWVNDHLSSYL